MKAYDILQEQKRSEALAAEIEATVREIWADMFFEWPEEIDINETEQPKEQN